MTVSLSSGPLMSEYLIALMIASVCVCCKRAGARLRPQLGAKWKALILVKLATGMKPGRGSCCCLPWHHLQQPWP